MTHPSEALRLVRGYPFIGGHLLQYITPNKVYPVLERGSPGRLIHDDAGKEVWISNNVLRRYMRVTTVQ